MEVGERNDRMVKTMSLRLLEELAVIVAAVVVLFLVARHIYVFGLEAGWFS